MSENTIPTFVAWPTGQQDRVRARIAEHREADEIVQGTGWQHGKGCAIGCSLDMYSHTAYSRVLGVPMVVVILIDRIHEDLPAELCLDWPMRVAMALKPGTDTTHVWSRFAIWLLREEHKSDVGEKVARLYEQRMEGNEPTESEWRATSGMVWIEEGLGTYEATEMAWALARSEEADAYGEAIAVLGLEWNPERVASYSQQWAQGLIQVLETSTSASNTLLM